MEQVLQQFFTWQVLSTMTGATAATMLLTQILKGISFIDKLPTRLLSYIVALVILITATVFSVPVTVSAIVLCLINSAVVALAAQGGYTMLSDGMRKK